MHEITLLSAIMRKLTDIATEHNVSRLAGVTLRLGAMAHISADHLSEHFEEAARDTPAEGATLSIVQDEDLGADHAQDILLESVDLPQ
ncbi:MAG: hydrogenase nickel incorporation protein HypA/HybF [Rhodothermales bacterium]|jgi:hydrogenase nickel incorporation protein HypA/HybF